MAAFSKFYTLATVRNTASAVVAVAVVWTLARKATANQRRRFLGLSFLRWTISYSGTICCTLSVPASDGQIPKQISH